MSTYWERRRRYPALFAQPEFAHLDMLELQSPGEAARFLRQRNGALARPGEV